MRGISILFLFMVIFVIHKTPISAQNTVTKLHDVKTIYLDDKSFSFISSSCMKIYGNQKIVCAKHLNNRKEFLVALKSWIEKYKFTLVSEKDDADAILLGNLSIDDNYWTKANAERTRELKKNKKEDKNSPSIFADQLPGELLWTVNSWLVNQNGDQLWTKGGWFPEPSYGWSSPAKIQAKKLAREIQYDFGKSK